ncbi:response regulator [Paenibacillus sepulcri]|uniref:Response regulator n=1 Tax=Paenibacillus sepulcri TaxID=359917 RepID=A0ABS7C487_9BACL|nr:response regulator [Paenibacillus sepulcri]
MKVILVDDDPLALKLLESELTAIGQVEIIGSYQDPRLVIQDMRAGLPDAVFLDIHMPFISGLELAEQILGESPDIQIVFVTAYQEHAVEAFELTAQDYIIKPFQRERLIKTCARVRRMLTLYSARRSDAALPVMIHCFKSFLIEGRVPGAAAVRWKTFKAQELFLYLLQHQGITVQKQHLLEHLWAEIDWKRAITQLYTTIYQIRMLIVKENLTIRIVNQDEGYRLELGGVEVDVLVWEKQLEQAPMLTEATLELHLKLFAMYRGDYLMEHEFLWAEPEKRRLRAIWQYHRHQLLDFYKTKGRYSEAIAFLLQVQKVNLTEEQVYFELMQLYQETGDRFSLEQQFALLQGMLSREYDASPKTEVREWYMNWKQTME